MAQAYSKKCKTLPTEVKNIENKIGTNPCEKKTVILDHFLERMKEKPPKEDVQNILDIKKMVLKID